MSSSKGWRLYLRVLRRGVVLAVSLGGLLVPVPARADFSSCAVPWEAFTSVRDYTKGGSVVRDYETSADPSNGGAAVTPSETDLASGSPGSDPGPFATPGVSYWDGGTAWDPANPSTMEDDYLMFRMRVTGNPVTNKNDFSSYHWNILFDVDGDGYKEYWIDINGGYQSSGTTDQLQVLYDDYNRQDIPDPNAARVAEFSASGLPLTTAGCSALSYDIGGTSYPSPGLSHTRVRAANDGTGDYFIEAQIPLTALNDLLGNQTLYPSSSAAFMFSTSASNTDPLQKDLMSEAHFITNKDPIEFGDLIPLDANAAPPIVEFVDANGDPADYYFQGDQVVVRVTDYSANADSNVAECYYVNVVNPAVQGGSTTDSDLVQVCETGPNTGVFTNLGGLQTTSGGGCTVAPGSAYPTRGWLVGLKTTTTTTAASWQLRWTAGGKDGSWSLWKNGTQVAGVTITTGVPYANSEISFTLVQNSPLAGDTLGFCTLAADSLVITAPTGNPTVNDGLLEAAYNGDPIYPEQIGAFYPGTGNPEAQDSALILGAASTCEGLLAPQIIRADGSLVGEYLVTTNSATSDVIYVRVVDAAANTRTNQKDTISVTVTSSYGGTTFDTETLTLTETDKNTGIFIGSLNTQIYDGTAANDGTLEGVDGGTITVSYGAKCPAYPDTALFYFPDAGGRVSFTNATGLDDVTFYGSGYPVYVKVDDSSIGGCTPTRPPLVVTLSGTYDSQTLTLVETFSGSGVYINTSPSTVTTAAYDGSAVANDGILELVDGEQVTVTYEDCTDGDTFLANNLKTDTAYFGAWYDAYAATRATIRGLRVDRGGVVEFATGVQIGTASFDLFETDDPRGGGLRKLNAEPVRALAGDSRAPILYRVETRPVSGRYLVIEETETSGSVRAIGPFEIEDARLARAFERIETRLESVGVARRDGIRASTAHASQARAASAPPRWGKARAAAGVRIETSRPGLVELPVAALQAFGLPGRGAGGAVRVTSQGAEVPAWRSLGPDGSPAIRFVAEPLSTDYADHNVYVVTWARSAPAMGVELTLSADPVEAGFTRIEKPSSYLAFDAPRGSDPWLWDWLVSGEGSWPYAWWWPESGDFDLPGLTPGASGDVPVRVHLLGDSDHTHTVTAWLNGVYVGSVTFRGHAYATLEGTVAAGSLRQQGNKLSLQYDAEHAGYWEGVVYLDYLDVGVPPAAGPVVVERVEAFDTQLPAASGVEYLIVTHADFAEAAARLAQLKQAAGLRTAVVDVQRAYDRYSGGIVEPRAVQALIRYFAEAGSLRYVLLLGDDSIAARGAWQWSWDEGAWVETRVPGFIPALYAWDPGSGRIPSDNLYADLDGDRRPDVAIGRLPAQTAEQAGTLVEKIAQQEEILRRNAGRHLFVSDNRSRGDADFPGLARSAAAALPGGAGVAWSSLAGGWSQARAALFQGWLAGAAVTHYFGHGGPDVWADEWLLNTWYGDDDILPLDAAPPTVLLSWTCLTQGFTGVTPTISERLLLLPRGGALASFGPAGITAPLRQHALSGRVYTHFLGEGLSLGEAVRRAKGEYLAGPDTLPVVEGFNLLGDPALTLPSAR